MKSHKKCGKLLIVSTDIKSWHLGHFYPWGQGEMWDKLQGQIRERAVPWQPRSVSCSSGSTLLNHSAVISRGKNRWFPWSLSVFEGVTNEPKSPKSCKTRLQNSQTSQLTWPWNTVDPWTTQRVGARHHPTHSRKSTYNSESPKT